MGSAVYLTSTVSTGCVSAFASQFVLCEVFRRVTLLSETSMVFLWFIGTLLFLRGGWSISAQSSYFFIGSHEDSTCGQQLEKLLVNTQGEHSTRGCHDQHDTIFGTAALYGITLAWLCMGGPVFSNLALLAMGQVCLFSANIVTKQAILGSLGRTTCSEKPPERCIPRVVLV